MLNQERKVSEQKISDVKICIGDALCELSPAAGRTPETEKARVILLNALDLLSHFFDGTR